MDQDCLLTYLHLLVTQNHFLNPLWHGFVQLSAMILSVLCREVGMTRLTEEQTCVSETSGVQSESEEKKGTVNDEKTSEEKDMSAGQKVRVTTEFYFHVLPDVTL